MDRAIAAGLGGLAAGFASLTVQEAVMIAVRQKLIEFS